MVPRPRDKPVIPHLVVVHEKHGPDGEVSQRKVRIVAGGHKQEEGVNVGDTFSSAAKLNTVRVVLAVAAQRDWEVDQVDVVAAYLNSELEEEVYMEPPCGVLKEGDGDLVCLLLKALYGLKQAGRAWYKKMAREFEEMGLIVSQADQSLFISNSTEGSLLVPVSTDDMVVAGSCRRIVDEFKAKLRMRFDITDGGEINWMLGFSIRRDRAARAIGLNQRAYIEAMAELFRIVDAKPIWTPMETGAVLSKDQCPSEPIKAPYREACGHVLWPSVVTRPDISFAIGILARFVQNPAEAHWAALKRVMRYLYTTRGLWLVLGGSNNRAEGFVDADWASQLDRHSVSGYVFKTGSGAVTWSSKKQNLIALSTAEAEYIAGAHAAREILWLRILFDEIGLDTTTPTLLRCDNQSAIALCKDSKFHARTKHIDIRYHFIREAVNEGKILMKYIPGEENPADILTKALRRPKFESFLNVLGVREFV
jgi:hypothetical protein